MSRRKTSPEPMPPTMAAADPTSQAAGGPREEAMIEASRAAIRLFLTARTSDFSVKALAAHTGLSERTFYRYFPRKELVLRPYIDAVMERIASDIRGYPPSRPVEEALIAAHARAFQESDDNSWEALLPLLSEQDSLRAVWLQILTDAEVALSSALADRLGLEPRSLKARLAGAVVVAAGRLALEQPHVQGARRDPVQVFAECLTQLPGDLFSPRP